MDQEHITIYTTKHKLISFLSMAFLEYLFRLFLFSIPVSILIIIYRHKKQTDGRSTNWPILGMIPGVLVNAHRLHDYTTEILILRGGTVVFKGPWFANIKLLLTTDPLNINHILSKNFVNYPKGDKFHKIFDILGDGVLNSDGKIWEINRKVLFSIFKHAGFQRTLETIIWNKLENGLLPILESICERGTTEIDLQDIFQRFAFDTVLKLLFDNDPESLSLHFPHTSLLKAFTDFEEAILLRHVTPSCLWKLQQILRVGKEKKLMNAWNNLDQFIYKCLAQKQEYKNMKHEAERFIFLEAITRELKDQIGTSMDPTKFLRDTLFNLMAAGKDTISSALSWFFYLLARNPIVENKILEEMQAHFDFSPRKRWSAAELDEMVYLHGALCESLRLYPPVPFNNKSPLQPEILPSGHKVDTNTNIILSFYSMGRMKSIWGEDCMEFKPERWISNSGGIKHEPSYKFPTFNAGPRTCLGKNMALSQLKMVSTTIIYHYHIQLVEGHLVLPANSVVLEMKYGLKVRLNKRSELN